MSNDQKQQALDRLHELRVRFREGLPGRIAALETDIRMLVEAENPDARAAAVETVRFHAHGLAGSGGTFGMPEISAIARRLENSFLSVDPNTALAEEWVATVKSLIVELRVAEDAPSDTVATEATEAIVWDTQMPGAVPAEPHKPVAILVEDDEAFAGLATEHLRYLGYRLHWLRRPDGLEDAVRELTPSVLIMDIVFANDADAGFRSVQRLKDDGHLGCPVIFVSNRDDFEARLGAARAGADRYLVKPVDVLELTETVRGLSSWPDLRPIRVAIVDDDRESLEYCKSLLSLAGMDTLIVDDPNLATTAIRDFDPDVLLLDVVMPGCTGFELARVIRQEDAYVHVPIIFLTGHQSEEAWLNSQASGGDEFLLKGLDDDRLISTVVARARRSRDIKALHRRLYMSENRFRAISENASDAIVTRDSDDRIVFWNAAAEALFGYSSSEIVGTKGLRLTNQDAAHQHKSGYNIAVDVSTAHWKQGGENYVTEIIRDVSEQRAAAEKIRQAKEEAERANLAKSDFLSAMSHELRTPLNAILGFTQLLASDSVNPLADDQKDAIRHVMSAGHHLLKLINEVLDLARIESDGLSVEIEDVDLNELIGACLTLTDSIAREHEVELKFDEKRSSRILVRADPTRLRQVLLNLMSNGVKYNRPGGWVRINSSDSGNGRIRIEVVDSGIGIPPDRQDELFKPFSRIGREDSGIEGTGLGLAVTQQLIDLMGGSIGFSSDAKHGTIFWFELPHGAGSQLPESVTEQRSSSNSAKTPTPDGRLRTILYIEDHPANQILMRRLTRRIPNCELTIASTAEKGLVLARGMVPDLILMDINLPGMNGFEALNALRAEPSTRSIPVIAISAAATSRDIECGKNANFEAYLTKPLQIEVTIAEVEKALAR
ncbi:MAG: response regulator [Rhodospirillaceae bacterium]|nr:response regulator [Rhodospirillaceae bacterium]